MDGRWVKMALGAALIAALLLFACGQHGRRDSTPAMSSSDSDVSVDISGALSELELMQTPKGVNPAVFAQLKEELRRALEARSSGKLAATPPLGEANAIHDFAIKAAGNASCYVSWHYRNLGDYNQDGTVGIADITPLAMHFGEGWGAEGENSLQAVIDGSNNGTVDIADVTPIAMNFGTEVVSYCLESSSNENGLYQIDETFALSIGLEGDIARMRFRVNCLLTADRWYRIAPQDSASGLGIFSDAAQAPGSPVPWVHTWGGSANEVTSGISKDSHGDVYVAGTTLSFGAGISDALLLKYGPDGNVKWQKTWGSNSYESAEGLAIGNDDSVYVTGVTGVLNPAASDAFLLKYAPDSALLWQKAWGGSSFDGVCATCITTDIFGNVYTSGYVKNIGPGDYDVFLLKYSPDGSLLWQKTWGGPGYETSSGLTSDDSGNLYAVGYTESFGAVNRDAFVLKFDADGALIWQKLWSGAANDYANAIAINDVGEIFVAGNTSSFGAGSEDALLLKYDSNGSLLWQYAWGGVGDDNAGALAVFGEYEFFVSGSTLSYGSGNWDIVLMRFDSSGASLCEKVWGGAAEDYSESIAIDSAEMIYLVGTSYSVGGVWQDIIGIKTPISGTTVDASGVFVVSNGVVGNPVGMETSPIGTVDTGGGLLDALSIVLSATYFSS